MALPIVKKRLTDLILKAQKADETRLVLLRKKILSMISVAGAKYFVNSTAEILKNDFQIEGCNDARIPLKRIFNIPLDELDEKLASHKYNLPQDHPIRTLSDDHKKSLGQLKELRLGLGRLNLNKETPPERIHNLLNKTRDYYRELDSHIKKEEEVLFPALEHSGMQEHPENLREEHKKFKDSLLNVINILDKTQDGPDSAIETIGKIKEEFISAISNHIFRETYIFYPAALEFIKEKDQWENIKKGFESIKDNL